MKLGIANVANVTPCMQLPLPFTILAGQHFDVADKEYLSFLLYLRSFKAHSPLCHFSYVKFATFAVIPPVVTNSAVEDKSLRLS